MLLNACEGGDEGGDRKPSPPRPDLRPISDVGPYLCDLVPEAEFRRVTGLSLRLSPKWSGDMTSNGLCLTYAQGREAPLGVHWGYGDGEQVIRRQEKAYADNSPHALPKELGKGFASASAGNPNPNYVISLFRCGKERPWLRIDFAPVVRGRDAVQDMFAFMRIAQKRFGQIHKCEPRPS
jgi:hypothetical protein